MKCPFCGHQEDKVVDSRASSDGLSIRRRRECLKCTKRYTTYEQIEERSLMIVKKDGRRERFDRQKLLAGLLKACEKRPVGMDQLEAMIDEIERALSQRFEREVPSREVGERVMERLHDLDPVAYVRFASVYREFKDAEHFVRELKELLARQGSK
ncbi:MAG TPA: transcriptional regulator NrdR [bacterium]